MITFFEELEQNSDSRRFYTRERRISRDITI